MSQLQFRVLAFFCIVAMGRVDLTIATPATTSLSFSSPSQVTPWELCRIAAKVLAGAPSTKVGAPNKLVKLDVEAFLGRPIPTGLKPIVNRIGPLLPPTIHANILYQRVLDASQSNSQSLMELTHQEMGFRIQIGLEDINRYPKSGPFLVTSNHPTGVPDGVSDGRILETIGHKDFAIVVAHFLESAMDAHPGLAGRFIFVDRRHRKFDNKNEEDWTPKEKRIFEQATQKNKEQFRRMLGLKKRGGILILYPTGSIASKLPARDHPVTYDGPWDPTTVTFAKSMGVVVPVFKVMRNSDHYLKLKQISVWRSRMAYFAEALNKSGQVMEVLVGEPYTWADVEAAVPFDKKFYSSLETPESRKTYEKKIDAERLAFMRSKVDELDPYKLAPQFAREDSQ